MCTKELKNTKAVTLIALVIMIVVLLILAGVALSLVVGENGITDRAVKAGKTQNIAGAKEKLELDVADYAAEFYQAKYVNNDPSATSIRDYIMEKFAGRYTPETSGPYEENFILEVDTDHYQLTLTSNINSDKTTSATATIESNGKVTWDATVYGSASGGSGGNEEQGGDTPTSSTKKMNEISLEDIELEIGASPYQIQLPENTESITSCSCTDSAISVSNTGVITVNGATAGAVVTITGVSGESTTVTVIVTSSQEPLAIGDTVPNFSTSLNDVELDDWRVFYIDGDYTYLILDGYLPGGAISDVDGLNYFAYYSIGPEDYDTKNFIDILTTTSNWDELITNGKLNNNSLNLTTSSNVWAMGSPKLDLWVNSWNAKHPDARLYLAPTENCNYENLEAYYIDLYPNPSEDCFYWNYWADYEDVDLGTLYDDLYLDSTINLPYVEGYWLASAGELYNYVVVKYDDNYPPDVGDSDHNDWGNPGAGHAGLRPVIKLPTSVLNQ